MYHSYLASNKNRRMLLVDKSPIATLIFFICLDKTGLVFVQQEEVGQKKFYFLGCEAHEKFGKYPNAICTLKSWVAFS